MGVDLNGYPGPLHMLELADQLELRTALRRQMREFFDAMKAETSPLGETLIANKAALDRAFADRTRSTDSLATITAHIGETQGQLRAEHLKYHLTTADLLSPHQRRRYAGLRAYR